jgi:glycosyltransferase involved in cell wall biosynthesis
VRVLTSTGRRGTLGPTDSVDHDRVEVERALHLEVLTGLLGSGVRLVAARRRLERANLTHVQRVVRDYRPDVALIWGMWNVPRSVPALIEELLGSRTAFYLCDYWPSLPSAYLQQWQAPARHALSGLPKRVVSRPIIARLAREQRARLRFEHPICVSAAVRTELVRAGVSVEHARVIYGGTQVRDLGPRANGQCPFDRLRLLYAGRLTATKGVHTAIRALGLLAQRGEHRVSLDVVGGGESGYERALRELAQRCEVEDRVSFQGGVSHAQMPDVFVQHEALLLPSEWEEPFARVVLEAMEAGLVVIGTTTGGTSEILLDGETGLSFPPGDSGVLAHQIQRLLDDPALARRLARAGRRCVEGRFRLERMVDELEGALREIAMPVRG